jgi:hypothetical protein
MPHEKWVQFFHVHTTIPFTLRSPPIISRVITNSFKLIKQSREQHDLCERSISLAMSRLWAAIWDKRETRRSYSERTSKSYYLWTHWRRGLRAHTPSIILCVQNQRMRAPQRRGSPHSGEGKKCIRRPFMMERRGYKKIPLVGFQDIYKTDLQNSFRPNRVILRGVAALVTQISG